MSAPQEVANEDERYAGFLSKLQELEEGRVESFKVKLNEELTSKTEEAKTAYQTDLGRIERTRKDAFTIDIRKNVDDVFASRAKQLLLKVDVSFLSDNLDGTLDISRQVEPQSTLIEVPDEATNRVEESSEISRVEPQSTLTEVPARVEESSGIPRQEERQISYADRRTEFTAARDSYKKKLSGVINDYRNSLSAFVGITTLVYATAVPCATLGLFNSFVITGGIVTGLFGLMGLSDIWDIVKEIKYWAESSRETRTGVQLDSVWSHVGKLVLKLCALIGLSVFFTIVLSRLLHDKRCDEKGKPAYPPVGSGHSAV